MKKRILIAGALLMVLAAAAVAAPAGEEKKMSKKAAKLMAKALEAIQAKQPDQAIDLLRQVTALEPGNAMVQHNLGVLHHEKNMVDEAIAHFETALRLQPDYPNAQRALRQALLDAGKAASGRREFEKSSGYLRKLDDVPALADENPGLRASAHYLLGYDLFNLKKYDEAGESFTRCLAVEDLQKDNLDLYANATYFLAMTGHVQEQYEASNENFRKYLALYGEGAAKPEFFSHSHYFIGANLFRLLEARLAKGDVARMAEGAAEIVPYLETAVNSQIPSEDAYVMLGNCFVYMKEYDQAVQAYQRLIERFPQSAQLKNYQDFLAQLQRIRQQEQKTGKKR